MRCSTLERCCSEAATRRRGAVDERLGDRLMIGDRAGDQLVDLRAVGLAGTATTRTRRCGTGRRAPCRRSRPATGCRRRWRSACGSGGRALRNSVQRHPQPELLGGTPDRFPFGGVGAAAGELEDRQLQHATRLEQLRDIELARVGFLLLGRGEGDFRQQLGDVQTTTAPLDHAGRQQSLDRFPYRRSGDTERFAQRALGRDRRPGCQLAGNDPFGEAERGPVRRPSVVSPVRTRPSRFVTAFGESGERALLGGEVERADDGLVLLVAPVLGGGPTTSPRTRAHRDPWRRGSCWRHGRWRLPARPAAWSRWRAAASSSSEPTSQAMWYMPTVRLPASEAPAPAPIVKKAMSW